MTDTPTHLLGLPRHPTPPLTAIQRKVLAAADKLRDPAISPERLERQVAAYAGIQAGYAQGWDVKPAPDASARLHAAIEGAGALLVLAELLELRGKI